MSTIAIGDIHGNLAALLDLLGQLSREVGRGDVVVFLGDYIDRGPDSRGCVEAILSFRMQTDAEVVCLQGNHEEWLLQTEQDYSRHSWLLGMEALDTVRSYSPDGAQLLREALHKAGLRLYLGRCRLPYELFFSAVPSSHRAFFKELTLFFANDDGFFSHAGVDPAITNAAEQTSESLVWGHAKFPAEYRGDHVVVYGHWNNADLGINGWPTARIRGNTIGIDTIAHGVLTAIRLPDRRIFQSARHVVTGQPL
jgi:serine/threonine protein phosphatase 1